MLQINRLIRILTLLFTQGFILLIISCTSKHEQALRYTLSIIDPATAYLQVQIDFRGFSDDTIILKMAGWSPGYYQLMDYGKKVKGIKATSKNGQSLPLEKTADFSWKVIPHGKPFSVSYEVLTDTRFVAENFLDTAHAYILPAATFLYTEQFENPDIQLQIIKPENWPDIATGLIPVTGQAATFSAPDLDFFFDCPVLAGNLEELPAFKVGGVQHRFIGYDMSEFDKKALMSGLEKAICVATDLIGDIPYDEYTFIGIGPGFGGIEHLNSTAVSFTGRGLDRPEAMTGTLSFLVHEYFHTYNVKRIRPFELGPFDYSRENRTSLLWVSEGLTVYYEYLILKRAGLINEDEFLTALSSLIQRAENDPGRRYQSLSEASYSTWSDGPFGGRGEDDRSISVYEKGACVGLILDLAIREASENRKSLDEVMRFLYRRYYQDLQRGFTEAEFREACELMAGKDLSSEFRYVNTTASPAYNAYLEVFGLKLTESKATDSDKMLFTIKMSGNLSPAQELFLEKWMY